MSVDIDSLPYMLDHIELYSGDDRVLCAFQPQNDDGSLDASWSGWKAQWRRFRNPDRAPTAIDLVLSVDETGTITVGVTGEMTRLMGGHSGVWDVRAFNPDGEELTWITGETSIIWDVTRDED